jgi:site-specific recombinase XerD
MAADVTARAQEHYARVRWLISLLYLMGLRISEVVGNPMGVFLDGAIATARTAGGWRSPARVTRSACCRRRLN